MFASFGRNERKQNRLFNTGVLIALLLLLCMTADAFGKRTEGVSVGPILPLPMWALWCIAGAAGVLFLCQTAVMIHRKSRTLGHNSVKQALDTLPDAICYFTPSGTLKLWNLQMHRLFRILTQKDLQHFNELQQALGSCDGTSSVLRLLHWSVKSGQWTGGVRSSKIREEKEAGEYVETTRQPQHTTGGSGGNPTAAYRGRLQLSPAGREVPKAIQNDPEHDSQRVQKAAAALGVR